MFRKLLTKLDGSTNSASNYTYGWNSKTCCWFWSGIGLECYISIDSWNSFAKDVRVDKWVPTVHKTINSVDHLRAEAYLDRINKDRDDELIKLKAFSLYKNLSLPLTLCIPNLASTITFIVYATTVYHTIHIIMHSNIYELDSLSPKWLMENTRSESMLEC